MYNILYINKVGINVTVGTLHTQHK